ncbi:MAG TPA: YqaJ viral recombinase family protein [Arenicellales bacterium]|nr:YqaJ viral recombinase family protein [Arenicellales bacterium]
MMQGTDEWRQARSGKVTASRIADLMARTRNGYGASRANYMAEIIVERLTGRPTNGYCNAAMQWGIETEPQARAAYEFRHDVEVAEVGFIAHPKIEGAGASPDGLVGGDGLVELKCPNTSTHIDIILSGSVPDRYVKQMQFQLACTGANWCDFVSFDPRLPEHLQLFQRRIERDDDLIGEIETAVRKFLAEVEGKIEALEKVAA